MNVSILYFFFHLAQAHSWLAATAVFFSEYLVYILPVVVVIYIFFTEKEPFKKSLYSALVVVIAVLAVDLFLKGFFAEARPFVTLGFTPLISETSFSFPSGHAALAGALFGATYFSISKHPWFTALIGILCIGISISRIMLGVHYPSDVVAGLVFGFLLAWAGHYFLHTSG